MSKKKKNTKTKKRPTKAKAKPRTSSTRRVKTGNGKRRNRYDSWTGVGETSGREIFDTATMKKLNIEDEQFEPIVRYLPPISTDALVHYFVARIATVSKKSGAKKEVVKLFVNKSWDRRVAGPLEDLDFTQLDEYEDRLISDAKLRIDTGTDWQADSFVWIFRDLDPPGCPTAKVIFTNRRTGRQVSAFWCWAPDPEISEVIRD